MLISEILLNNAKRSPNNTAIQFNEEVITYSELASFINQTAIKLKAYGINKGKKILIFLPNCPEFIISYFAISSLGGISILADIKYNDELLTIMGENKVSYIITDIHNKEKIDKIVHKYQERSSNIDKGVSSEGSMLKVITADQLVDYNKSTAGEALCLDNLDLDDEAMILYTSGSLGKPKGVINTNRTLLAAAENYLASFEIFPNDRLLAVTPFFHSYAFGSCMLAGLASGAALLLLDSFQPRKLLKLMHKEKATIFHGVPYMYSLINQHYDEKLYCLESLRFCISAGAPLQREVAEKFFCLTQKVIHQEYGSSETGTIALNRSDDLELNIISVGNPLKNTQLRIVKEENDEIGELQVKNPGHSVGYVGMEPFTRDWHQMGDLGKVDDHRNIYILGRTKRMINIAGLKVNPYEVEAVIASHPDIADVLVRGSEHQDFGEIVEALVVRRISEISEDQLLRFCHNHLAMYKVPKKIIWVEELSKTSLGKAKQI